MMTPHPPARAREHPRPRASPGSRCPAGSPSAQHDVARLRVEVAEVRGQVERREATAQGDVARLIMELRFDLLGVGCSGVRSSRCAGAARGRHRERRNDQEIVGSRWSIGTSCANLYCERANFPRPLPSPDPNASLPAEPATGRVVVIAPTRAACETIELAMSLDIETLLAREHGEHIRRLAASGRVRDRRGDGHRGRRSRSGRSRRPSCRRRSRSGS